MKSGDYVGGTGGCWVVVGCWFDSNIWGFPRIGGTPKSSILYRILPYTPILGS